MQCELIQIEGKQIERITYHEQPVLTLRMVAELHEKPSDSPRKRFNDNKKRFIPDVDYYVVPYEEWSQISLSVFRTAVQTGQRNPMIFLTESGYLLLVKTFTDDISWRIQRQLVNDYFRAKELIETVQQEVMGHIAAIEAKHLEYDRTIASLAQIVHERGKKDQAEMETELRHANERAERFALESALKDKIIEAERRKADAEQRLAAAAQKAAVLEVEKIALENKLKSQPRVPVYRKRQPITPELRQEIISKKKEGLSNSEIARLVDRSPSSIRNILRAAGYPAEQGIIAIRRARKEAPNG